MADTAAQQAFIDSNGSKGNPIVRGKDRKGLPRESVKQKERTAFLHGIKADRLARQELRTGHYFCNTCGRQFWDYDEAWEQLTVSHIEPRTSGARYERRSEPFFGADDPTNILIDCVVCNQARTPREPMWSNA
jgi:5-methylcytosine-specific restriction endonuclease McrA